MRNGSLSRLFFSGVFAVVFMATGVAAEGGPAKARSFAEYLPGDTLFFVEVPDFPSARRRYLVLPRAQVWWKGAGRELVEMYLDASEDPNGEMRGSIKTLIDLTRVLPGKFAFAAVNDEEAEWVPIAMLMMADGGDQAWDISRKFHNLTESDMAGFVEDEWDDFDELLIAGERFIEGGFTFSGAPKGIAVASDSEGAIENLLRSFNNKPGNSLAANPIFRRALRQAGPNPDFFLYAGFDPMFKMEDEWLDPEEMEKREVSGIRQLQVMSLSGKFFRDGVVDFITFFLKGKPRGIWPLLSPLPLSRHTWVGLPADTSGFASVDIDLANRWRPMLDLMETVTDEVDKDTVIDSFRELREATGISFDKDILPLTAGEITYALLDELPGMRPAKYAGDKMDWLEFLVIEFKDPEGMRRLWRQRTGNGRLEIKKRRFLDRDGWEFEEGMDVPQFYAFMDGPNLYLALDPGPLERVAAALAGRSKRLIDTPEFKKASAWLPKDTGFVGYSSLRKVLNSIYMSARYECSKAGVEDFPELDAFMQDITPLTAALRTGEGSFTFEVHSPHGFFSFYMQFIGHIEWRFWGERRAERETRGGAAYKAAMTEIKKLNTPEAKIKVLIAARKKFADTDYMTPVMLEIRRQQSIYRMGGAEDALDTIRIMATGRGRPYLSKGSDDGIKNGMKFVVWRGGENIATVRVTKVYENVSACIVLERFDKIGPSEGDIAVLEE